MAVKRIDTGHTVWDGETTFKVYLIGGTEFGVYENGDEANKDADYTSRESFDALRKLFEGRADRLQKQQREKAKGQPVLVSVLTHDEDGVTDGAISGVTADGSRVRSTGAKRLSSYDYVYTRFTEEERQTFKQLGKAVTVAQQAKQQFLDDRYLGRASDVGRAVERGEPVLTGAERARARR